MSLSTEFFAVTAEALQARVERPRVLSGRRPRGRSAGERCPLSSAGGVWRGAAVKLFAIFLLKMVHSRAFHACFKGSDAVTPSEISSVNTNRKAEGRMR